MVSSYTGSGDMCSGRRTITENPWLVKSWWIDSMSSNSRITIGCTESGRPRNGLRRKLSNRRTTMVTPFKVVAVPLVEPQIPQMLFNVHPV